MDCFELARHVFVTYVRNVGPHRAGNRAGPREAKHFFPVVSCIDWGPGKSAVSAREGVAVGIARKIGVMAWPSAPLFILMGKKSEKHFRENDLLLGPVVALLISDGRFGRE